MCSYSGFYMPQGESQAKEEERCKMEQGSRRDQRSRVHQQA